MSPPRRLVPEHFRPDGLPKRAFPTVDAAQPLIEANPGSKRRPYHAYECPLCKQWHIGKRPPRRSQRGRSRR